MNVLHVYGIYIRKAGYPIDAKLPGDRYMADLAFFPKSQDGKVVALILKDVFSGFALITPLANMVKRMNVY